MAMDSKTYIILSIDCHGRTFIRLFKTTVLRLRTLRNLAGYVHFVDCLYNEFLSNFSPGGSIMFLILAGS